MKAGENAESLIFSDADMPDRSGSAGGQAGSSGAAPSASNPAPPEGRVSRWTLVRQEVETNYKQRNAKMQTMFKALIMEARDEKDRHPCDMSGALDAGFSTGKVAAPGAVLAVDDKDRKKIEKHDAKMRKIQMTAMKESYREVQSRRKSLAAAKRRAEAQETFHMQQLLMLNEQLEAERTERAFREKVQLAMSAKLEAEARAASAAALRQLKAQLEHNEAMDTPAASLR